MYKRPESVLVVIHTAQGQILLLRRADTPDFWQSVTGSLEWGEEDRLVAARREVAEETGLAPVSGWHDWGESAEYAIYPHFRARYAPGVRVNREYRFSLTVPVAGPVRLNPAEHVEFAWLPWREAAGRCRSWTNREAVSQLASRRAWMP